MSKANKQATFASRRSASDRSAWARRRPGTVAILSAVLVMSTGCAALVHPPAPPDAPPPPVVEPYNGPTLCNVLGVPDAAACAQKCGEKICQCIQRQFPGPGTPPVLGEVTMDSAPAVKCAAEILAAEAEAPQKIDAIRYLGRMGCTKCYPCVEEGLIAALDDCTEEVRFEAAKAIRQTAREECCCCRYTSCCTQKVYTKLQKVVFETRDDGCPIEPSPRVRRVAREALKMCCNPIPSVQEPVPTEGPTGAPPLPPPLPPQEAPAEGPPAESAAATKSAAPATATASKESATGDAAKETSATPATTTSDSTSDSVKATPAALTTTKAETAVPIVGPAPAPAPAKCNCAK